MAFEDALAFVKAQLGSLEIADEDRIGGVLVYLVGFLRIHTLGDRGREYGTVLLNAGCASGLWYVNGLVADIRRMIHSVVHELIVLKEFLLYIGDPDFFF
jgi:hypothetical protein